MSTGRTVTIVMTESDVRALVEKLVFAFHCYESRGQYTEARTCERLLGHIKSVPMEAA